MTARANRSLPSRHFDDEALPVLILQPDGAYQAGDRSRAFPVLPLAEFRATPLTFDPDDETAWFLGLRDRVRAVVASLRRP